jgi:hypothetical protein
MVEVGGAQRQIDGKLLQGVGELPVRAVAGEARRALRQGAQLVGNVFDHWPKSPVRLKSCNARDLGIFALRRLVACRQKFAICRQQAPPSLSGQSPADYLDAIPVDQENAFDCNGCRAL